MGRDGLERRPGVEEPHRDVLRRAGLVRVHRADDVVGLGNDADLGRVLRALRIGRDLKRSRAANKAWYCWKAFVVFSAVAGVDWLWRFLT